MAGTRRVTGVASGGTALRPVIVQDVSDGAVLMLAWANDEALEATRRTGEAHFWSRSRDSLWHKGATSGNRMTVVEVATDCDGDALLYRVRPSGPACHTGSRSCFDRSAGATQQPRQPMSLAALEEIVRARATAPAAESYTARLLVDGPRRPARKVIEEAGEVAVAGLAEGATEVADEAADLLYHLLVLLRARDVPLAAVMARLAARHDRQSSSASQGAR